MTRAAIALGSNIGDSASILSQALAALDQHPRVSLVSHSSWYRTVPVGPVQDDFLNGCALLDTDLEAQALLALLLSTEHDFGRVRLQHWGPRSLDLDLILFGDQIIASDTLQVPHPPSGGAFVCAHAPRRNRWPMDRTQQRPHDQRIG